MKQDALQDAEKYNKSHQRKRRWYKVVTSLACVVVFCTVYALILPAITMEKNTCGMEEHTHTDNCYTQVTTIARNNSASIDESINESEGNLTCTLPEDENHTHGPRCYGTWELTCGMEEHVHTDACYTSEETLPQGDLEIVLPADAEIPAGYDVEYRYVDPDNRFGVMVCAPEGALPEGAVLAAELLDPGSEAYESAEEALADEVYDGFAALDIHFLLEGEEVEPTESVYVCLHVAGLLPEDADEGSLAVQHHRQPDAAMESVDTEVEIVADAGAEIGRVEALEGTDGASQDVAAAFELDGFSTVTVTWSTSGEAVSLASSNTTATPADNVYPVDAINKWDENANVILVYPQKFTNQTIENGYVVNLHACLPDAFPSNDTVKSDWMVYRIENRSGRYQVLQAGIAAGTTGVQVSDAYLLLVKTETYNLLYKPSANWQGGYDASVDGAGDTVQINLQCTNTDEKSGSGTPLAYLTFFPKNRTATAAASGNDVASVQDSAIKFQLFDYSTKINRLNGGDTGWRALHQYFQFRGQNDYDGTLKDGNTDERYDIDGFKLNHATVERTLTKNYPVLDPNRDALGNAKSPTVTTEMLSMEDRSLAYLFGGVSDKAVTAYSPVNTILQKSGTHYYYNSADNAVDYDINNRMFRVRSYVERNSSTANYGNAQTYYDFLPFNYTGGTVVGTVGTDGRTYNLPTEKVDYWFGMRMDVSFYQGKNGLLDNEEMVFHFSGDDDVWVFIDDVLVLDLGGTHGTVTGSINFATGEIKQYLDWNGTVGTERETSFPTTIRACYDAAGTKPNGGWSDNGKTFADYTQHKLSFFYMERGCAVANCSIDFNLPTLPEKALQVTKELAGNTDADQDVVRYLQNTMTYKFRVVKANSDGTPSNELLIKSGDTYTLTGAGIDGSETGTVGADGYFSLKSGQVAEFSDMMKRFGDSTPKQYFVQELLPANLKGQYADIVYTVGSGTGTCTEKTTDIGTDFVGFNSPELKADTGNLVAYKNVVETEKLSNLAITKTQIGGSAQNQPAYYYMKVQLGPDQNSLVPLAVGTPYFVGNEIRNVQTEGVIALKAGETAYVKLLAGTCYKVEEVADENGTALTGNEGYIPTYTNASGTVKDIGSTVAIAVQNTFPTGDLELTKIVKHLSGGSTDGEFAFEIKFPVGVNWNDTTVYTATYTTTNSGSVHTDNTLSFTKQGNYAVATVNLYHGEKVAITGLPVDAEITITETNADGYAVGWIVNTNDEIYSQSVAVAISKDATTSVICTNTTGYELPDTGGSGTDLYTMGGLLLILAACLLLYIETRHRKELTNDF